ncbi:MAG: SpoIID/LytB domain-containing protein, partial [Omnitrophica bacterium]|nr:SpoIID/LytB domain-containing protein [Candidatus Omnitrophota bacterium]
MKKTAFFLLTSAILISLFLSEYGRSQDNSSIIRVCVEKDKDEILLKVKSAYRILALNSGLELDKGRRIRGAYVTPLNSGIRLGGKEFKVYGIRIIPRKDSSIYLGKKRFRGIIDIIRTKEMKLLVVNHLGLEQYLYGVLNREVPYYWPMETLKAQAIAARTFAQYRIGISGEKDFDVTSDIYSQVYGGRSKESRNTTRAVNATKGMVLTQNGEFLPAYYHSICAGHTENAKHVFEVNLKPLRGRRDPYCGGAKGMHWKAIFSYKQMEERLNNYGIKVKGINFIVEGRRDRSGRLETIKIRDKEGVKSIKGYKFRLALGPNMVRSTNFRIRITRKGVLFTGKGWGHGVGMCQWGAFGMGKRYFRYKQILNFYYPGADIKTLSR